LEQLFVYPFGLVRLWIISRGKKPFKQLVKENSFEEVATHGGLFFLDLIAGCGALGLSLMLLYLIGSLAWQGLKRVIEYTV
jgi:hypothetical protein